jgi:hypothetical protein
MALSGDILAKAIVDAIIDPKASAEARTKVEDVWKKIANNIVDHIKANAVVTVAAGISVATTGSAAAQTGATTAPGSGTVA